MAQWENTVIRRGIPGATKFSQEHPEFSSTTCSFLQSGGEGIVQPHPSPINRIACLFFGYPLGIQAQPLRQKCKIVDFFNVI